MWPFERKKARRLAEVHAAVVAASAVESGTSAAVDVSVAVSLLATIVSTNAVVSPFTGLRTGILHIELVERYSRSSDSANDGAANDSYETLGSMVLGDLVTLRDEDGAELTLVGRRARIQPAHERRGATPLAGIPAEMAPLLAKSRGRGIICYRELPLGEGDRVRLEALVNTAQSVASGYRSGAMRTYVVRDDLAPVVLTEIVEEPRW